MTARWPIGTLLAILWLAQWAGNPVHSQSTDSPRRVAAGATRPEEQIDLRQAVVLTPPAIDRRMARVVAMLVEEVQAHTRIRWHVSTVRPKPPIPVISLAQVSSAAAPTED